VQPWSGRLVVPAGGTAERSLTVAVADVGGCVGATWELAYTAS
jgi:hypothetical protein